MRLETLNFINEELSKLVNYEFEQWTSDVVYPYWVGSFTEVPGDGDMAETSFMLEGFARNSEEDCAILKLLEEKEIIEKKYKHGVKTILPSGAGVVILFENALCNIPTGDAELKKIQIYLNIKEWSVI